MIDLLVRIQHHPKRADLLERLLPKLDGLRVEVIDDPRPDAQRAAPWRTYLRCLSEPWDGTHLLIVQDDALPADGFAQAAVRALEAKPDAIVAYFLAQAPAATARLARAAYFARQRWCEIAPRDWIPVVATAFPRENAEQLVRYAESAVGAHQIGDDSIVGRYRRLHNVPAFATIPSLVEHPDDSPSIVRHRGHHAVPRRALIFESGLDVRALAWT